MSTCNAPSALEREKAITRELVKNMRGKWASVLPRILPEMADAIAAGDHKHIDCPYHGGKKDFRILRDFDETGGCICTCNEHMSDGFKVIMYARSCDFMQAKQLVIDALGGTICTHHIKVVQSRRVDPEKKEAKDSRVRDRIRTVWDGVLPLGHTRSAVARAYLHGRGIRGDFNLPCVQFHPKLPYWAEQKDGQWKREGSYPAIISLIKDTHDKAVTLHRMWIRHDGKGKAPVEDPRKMEVIPSDRRLDGSAIKLDLWEHPVLSVAEGLETALSARMLMSDLSIPTWSMVNAGLLEKLVVPSYVRAVVIWADKDKSERGQEAAVSLCLRLRAQGLRCIVMLPPQEIPQGKKSVDWNDVVRMQGVPVTREHPGFLYFLGGLKEWLGTQVAC